MNTPPDFKVTSDVPLVGGGRKVAEMTTMYLPGQPMVVRGDPDEDDPVSKPRILGILPGPGPAFVIARCEDGTLWIIDLRAPQNGWAQLHGPPTERAQFDGNPRGG